MVWNKLLEILVHLPYAFYSTCIYSLCKFCFFSMEPSLVLEMGLVIVHQSMVWLEMSLETKVRTCRKAPDKACFSTVKVLIFFLLLH